MEKGRTPAILLVTVFAAVATLYLNSLSVPRARSAGEVVSGISSARYLDNVRYLASDQMKGRGDGSPELNRAAGYIASQFGSWGLKPMGDNGGYFQSFEITTGAAPGHNNDLELNGNPVSRDDFTPVMFSNSADVDGPLAFVGYGITAPGLKYDDYGGGATISGGGMIAVAIRQSPDNKSAAHLGHASLVDKAINAKQHGAKAVIFINDPHEADDDIRAASRSEETADLGIPAVFAKRDVLLSLFKTAGKDIAALQKKIDSDMKPESFLLTEAHVHLATDIVRTRKTVRNVMGAIDGSDPTLKKEWVVVGAHYDHLGLGDQNSLAPSEIGQVHHGADDNASGTAGVLALARLAGANSHEWKRSVLFITFAGEELGLLGSSNFVNHPTIPLKNVTSMINMDMIGRLRNDRLYVGGVGTSPSFKPLLEEMNKSPQLKLDYSDSGYGASDHMSFNAKKIPVLFFFSGLHTDYHKPSDTADKINADGAVRVLSLVYTMMDRLAADSPRPEYTEVEQPQAPSSGSGGDGYGPYFGSVPDFRDDLKGVLFADVQTNSPAAKAGLKQGDLLVEFDGKPVQNLYDFFYALSPKKGGDKVAVVVKRDGQDVKVDVTLERRR